MRLTAPPMAPLPIFPFPRHNPHFLADEQETRFVAEVLGPALALPLSADAV